MKFCLLFFLLSLVLDVRASCVNESKCYRECLRCCTQTVQAEQVFAENKQAASDFKDYCAYDDSSLEQVQAYREVYNKYKIDSSTFYLICKESRFANETHVTLSYNDCRKKCNYKPDDCGSKTIETKK